MRSQSVRAFFEVWLAGKKVSTKENVHRQYAQILTAFLNGLGKKADKSLNGITPKDVAAFRDARLGARVSTGTLSIDMQTIRSVFSGARRQGLILYNPAEAVELPVNRPQERDVFTPAEIRALLNVASEEWKTLILCGYYLCGRLSDMVALSWDAVDPTAGVIFYLQRKTGGRSRSQFTRSSKKRLLAIAGDQRGPLCPTLATTRVNGRNGLSNQFSTLMTQASVDRRRVHSSKKSFSRKSFHSLRHSFSSQLANLGISADLRMKLTGPKSLDVPALHTRRAGTA